MDIVFYIIIFILGTLLGSFYATVIKRISKGKKVFSLHSYCANCGEKLGLLEKVPIFSYALLKGKCKHCEKKIEYKYIIWETIAGLLFLVSALTFNISITKFNLTNLISFTFIILYFSFIILTIGIDAEKRNMSPSVLAFGIINSLIYIIYMCITEKESVYIYLIYLITMVLLLVLNIMSTKKRAQSSYLIDLLTMVLIMLIFTGEHACILTIGGTLLSIGLYILIKKMQKGKNRGRKNNYGLNIKIAFIMGILNILMFLILVNI